MLIFDGQGLLKSLTRIIQVPIKGLERQVSDLIHIKTGGAERTRSIRKREFDKLRTLRLHQVTGEEEHRQPFFPTDMHSKMEDSASTIKKIDEIEAQMSMQWWKTERLDLGKSK